MKLLLLLHLFLAPDTLRVESAQVTLGTLGLGAEVSVKAADRLGVRGGVNYVAFDKAQKIETDTDSYLHIHPDLYTAHVYALADYHLLKKKWLRLTAGLAYAPFQKYSGFVFTEGDVKLGELTIPHEEFGHANLEITWNRLKPYLGAGIGTLEMKHKVGFGLDLGFYYLGAPRLALDYEGFLETTTIDEELVKIQDNMSGYRYYPYLGVQVRYRIE